LLVLQDLPKDKHRINCIDGKSFVIELTSSSVLVLPSFCDIIPPEISKGDFCYIVIILIVLGQGTLYLTKCLPHFIKICLTLVPIFIILILSIFVFTTQLLLDS
jgi:hypothetical protein